MNLSTSLTSAVVTVAGLALTATALTTAGAASAAPSPEASAAKRGVTVTATTKSAEVVQDDRVVIKGTVTRAVRGQRVVLQISYDGAGFKRTKITDKVDGQGRFRLVDTVGSSRSRTYRALVPATRKTRTARSAALPVVVYSWRDLTSVPQVRSEGTARLGDTKINGVLYPDSVGAWNGTSLPAVRGGADYNLDYRCRELETRVGLNDLSATGASGVIHLRTDGTERFTGSYALAQSAIATVALTDVFRLSFDWESTVEGAQALPALGSPRILCRD